MAYIVSLISGLICLILVSLLYRLNMLFVFALYCFSIFIGKLTNHSCVLTLLPFLVSKMCFTQPFFKSGNFFEDFWKFYLLTPGKMAQKNRKCGKLVGWSMVFKVWICCIGFLSFQKRLPSLGVSLRATLNISLRYLKIIWKSIPWAL